MQVKRQRGMQESVFRLKRSNDKQPTRQRDKSSKGQIDRSTKHQERFDVIRDCVGFVETTNANQPAGAVAEFSGGLTLEIVTRAIRMPTQAIKHAIAMRRSRF